jgi:hypothetical protein
MATADDSGSRTSQDSCVYDERIYVSWLWVAALAVALIVAGSLVT